MAGILRKIFRFLLLQGKKPRFCKVEGHHDGAASSLQRTDEGLRRTTCRIDIIDDNDLTPAEVIVVDMHVVLDIRRQLIFTSDVGTLTAAANGHALEAVLGAGQAAKHFREPFPAPDVGHLRAGRDTDDDDVMQVVAR